MEEYLDIYIGIISSLLDNYEFSIEKDEEYAILTIDYLNTIIELHDDLISQWIKVPNVFIIQ